MAAVDLNRVQFWAPPTYNQYPAPQRKGSYIRKESSQSQPVPLSNKADRKRTAQSQSTTTAARHQREDSSAGVQGMTGCNSDSASLEVEVEVDADLPPIEEFFGPRRECSAGVGQNAAAASQDPSQPTPDDSQGTQDRPLILEDDEPNTPSREAAAVFALADAGADRTSQLTLAMDPPSHDIENVCELEKALLLAFEEQERSSTATSLDSPRPPRCSTEPPHPQGGVSHGVLEELERGSPARNQGQVEEELQEPQEHHQEQDLIEEAIRQAVQVQAEHDDQDNNATEEMNSVTHHVESSSNNGYDTPSEDDEDARPAKRRKLPSVSTEDLKARNRTARSTPDPEMEDARSQVNYRSLPTQVDHQHHTPPTSRSPSVTVESVPVAEHQEWPVQGFFKRTRIGNQTTYNLEWTLSHVPEHLHLPFISEVLGNNESFPAAAAYSNAVAHSKVHPAVPQPQEKGARWTEDEDAVLLRMKKNGCSWNKICAALPGRTKGTIQVRHSMLKKSNRSILPSSTAA